MDDTYQINVAKTEFREAYNCGDVHQLLSVFEDEGFTDMSEDHPNLYGQEAREGLRERSTELFGEYSVRLAVIINDIVVLGDTAYDFGWHEFTLEPKNGGETIRKRQRYLELWKKNPRGEWKISVFVNNADVREEFAGRVSHWFLSEEQPGNPSGSMPSSR
jgi:ketosteroid isomerase-like protein